MNDDEEHNKFHKGHFAVERGECKHCKGSTDLHGRRLECSEWLRMQ